MTRRRGLFYFADTEGIPLDIAISKLRSVGLISSEGDVFVLLCQFVLDATKAGWKPDKIRSDLRELPLLGIPVPSMLLQPYTHITEVRMVETAEGIGHRKWSYEKATDGTLSLYEGRTKLATLTVHGATVFELMVTVPQLWAAANDVLRDASPENVKVLANMVAKSVGKKDWTQVEQPT